MKTLPGVVRRGLIWNVVPFVLTWLLLTAVAAGFYSARFESTTLETQPDADRSQVVMILGSVVAGFFGTLTVALPVVLIDFWSWTKERRLQMLVILPLIAVELLIGLLFGLSMVLVALFGFLQWTYWTFMWFARDTSAPLQTPTPESSTPEATVQPTLRDEPLPSVENEPTAEDLDTDTTIENLEASMVDLANQIMEEK